MPFMTLSNVLTLSVTHNVQFIVCELTYTNKLDKRQYYDPTFVPLIHPSMSVSPAKSSPTKDSPMPTHLSSNCYDLIPSWKEFSELLLNLCISESLKPYISKYDQGALMNPYQ